VPLIPLVVLKGSKIQASRFWGMPGPLSMTEMTTVGRRMVPAFFLCGRDSLKATLTVTTPISGSTASMAFAMRFMMTWWMREGSTEIGGISGSASTMRAMSFSLQICSMSWAQSCAILLMCVSSRSSCSFRPKVSMFMVSEAMRSRFLRRIPQPLRAMARSPLRSPISTTSAPPLRPWRIFLMEWERFATVSPMAAMRSELTLLRCSSAFARASPVCCPMALRSASCCRSKAWWIVEESM